ncbi:MAG: hypothetical protein NZM06_07880 [Chloroherpetonaceae bacterium]|nr:hypothetical protein [Chloroherpetonaceae bacterium]MDW8437667.1 hypothetical protein [Chloroherpetonaceae bacterium]
MPEPKKLSPMMQKKLAEQQAKAAAAPEAKTEAPAAEAPAAEPTPAPKAAPVVATSAPKVEGPSTKPETTWKLEKNPNGERYGYGDGYASVFGTPPAIDDAYETIRIVSKIPATVLDGAIRFFKKVIS